MSEINFSEYEDIMNSHNDDREKLLSVKQCLDTAIDGILVPEKNLSSTLKRLLNAVINVENTFNALKIIGDIEKIDIPRPERTAYMKDKRWIKWETLLEKREDEDMSFVFDDEEIKADAEGI